jgi:hypothetical protein
MGTHCFHTDKEKRLKTFQTSDLFFYRVPEKAVE